ncbi:uncharacterized protein TNCV_2307291 [Trichonephila clavipes]|nr:uncharacterized protein TNCV_2307291 [Trichonephila clavipes]
MDSSRRTECASACREESKNEYTKCSKLSRGFPLQRLEDSPRTTHASVSRAACPDTATGRLCTSCCFRTLVPWKMCYESPFPDEVLISDEASFTREGIFNTHNDHIWVVENPHAVRRRAAQIRFSVNVWAGIMGNHLIGPYLFLCRLTGLNYLLFLQQVLPQLLRDEQISASTQQTMWFQHDGAPAHFSGDVRIYLDVTFGQQWIGRDGPVRWPARSPDLSCLDFYFWGHMKSLVYDTPVDNAEELVARIAVAAGEIRNSPGVFQNVRMSMRRRCEACIVARGRNFEHLL